MTKKKSNSEERSHPLPWMVGILLLLGAVVVGGLYWNRTRTVEQVQFTGYEYVTRKQLQNHVEISIGVDPDSLNYESIIRQIEKIAYVERVNLKMQPSGTLMIDISERQPIALLINDSEQCYVDSNGVKLPLKITKTAAVPILYGFKVKPITDTLATKAFEKVSVFLQRLRQNPASNATISAVSWSDENGVIALTNSSAVKLIFGKGHYKKRLRNWEAFYAQVIRYKGLERFQTVNLSFKGQIVTHENE